MDDKTLITFYYGDPKTEITGDHGLKKRKKARSNGRLKLEYPVAALPANIYCLIDVLVSKQKLKTILFLVHFKI